MRKHLLSFLTATALTSMGISAVQAADLPARTAPAPVIAAVPVFTWTGFYVGVNAGWAWGENNHNDGFGSVFVPAGTFPGVFATTSGTLSTPFGFGVRNNNNDGFTGGGQVGYNYQTGSWVIGVEADIQGIANSNNHNDAFAITPTFATLTGPGLPPGVVVVPGGGIRGLDWFGTVRARVGVAFDRALIYATGGFAYGGGGGGNNFGFFDNGSSTRTGWVLGGGVEYAFTNNFTARLEGLWVGLNRDHNNFGGVVYSAANNAIFVSDGGGHRNNDFGVIRAGLNYKFSSY